MAVTIKTDRAAWKAATDKAADFAAASLAEQMMNDSRDYIPTDGENMLLMNDIGFWNFVQTEKLPNSHFLIQSDRFSFNELVRNSSLPSFTTDLAKQYLGINDDRIEVPISDPEASVTYYLLCLKNSRKAYQALFNAL